MRTRFSFFMILMLGMSAHAYAFYCNTQKGRGYINLGDSAQKVQGICGAPDAEDKSMGGGEALVTIQNWTYTHKPIETKFDSPTPQSHTVYPPDVTFQIVKNKVASIYVQGKKLSRSNLCRTGMQVQVGQSAQSVMDSCGRPDVVNSKQQKINTPQQQLITWTYNAPSGAPTVLNFTNGQLSKIGQD